MEHNVRERNPQKVKERWERVCASATSKYPSVQMDASYWLRDEDTFFRILSDICRIGAREDRALAGEPRRSGPKRALSGEEAAEQLALIGMPHAARLAARSGFVPKPRKKRS
jgi:hypothetical protein